jgi:hypothetical protein
MIKDMSAERKRVDAILDKIDDEVPGIPFSVRLTKTEREQLGRLAKSYKRPMGQVMQMLLHQAIQDYELDGEVFALTTQR